MENKLLEEFGVENYKELLDYMRKHPEDERVKELGELLRAFGVEYEG